RDLPTNLGFQKDGAAFALHAHVERQRQKLQDLRQGRPAEGGGEATVGERSVDQVNVHVVPALELGDRIAEAGRVEPEITLGPGDVRRDVHVAGQRREARRGQLGEIALPEGEQRLRGLAPAARLSPRRGQRLV